MWVSDFTYVPTWFAYAAFIIDVYSRRVVGWRVAATMTTDMVMDALEMAVWNRRTTMIDGVIANSDAGGQYVSVRYTERLAEFGAKPSIGTVGDSYDSSLAESFNGIIDNVVAAAERLGVTWPIAIDTNKRTFHAWQEGSTAYWPRIYLLDRSGHV